VSTPIRLQTQVWNPLGDRRALLLHGLTSDGTAWWRLASQLADAGWMVVAPDLRSHGRSPTAIDHAFATMARDVTLLGSGYELVVGHSLGGAIAAHLLAAPGFADAAVLVDPVVRIEPAAREELRLRLRAQVGGSLDAASVRTGEPAWDERDVQRKLLAAALVTPDVVDVVFADNDPWDVTEEVLATSTRLHLLGADPDAGGLLQLDLGKALADVDRITYELLAGVGHSIHRERPDLLRRAIERLLPDAFESALQGGEA
jgi:pimeloyl-ACP methyl ester carboxylesterase